MTGIYHYLTRIIPALSVVALAILLVFSFIVAPRGRTDGDEHHGEATISQLILGAYTVLLHIMSIMFPARVCWAMGDVTKRMKEAAASSDTPKRRRNKASKNERGSPPKKGPLMVIILPAYKEEMATLEETLRVLASHQQARNTYHLIVRRLSKLTINADVLKIYLAMEEKEEKSDFKARTLIDEFRRSFNRMSYTIHPCGLPGEAQGKSSNESWAARQALRDYPDAAKKDIIITTMDADTHLSTRYFAQVAQYHIDCPETNDETIYVPPLVFDRNLHHVPLPVRTADLMWAGAGLSSLHSGSSICIPTSVYSLPMALVERVGGWDTGPGAIGEDMHMYLKCFFALSGNLEVRVVYAAASQCNVSSDVKGFSGYMDGLNARYKQALRHMWGSLDTGYAVRQAVSMIGTHFHAQRTAVKESTNLLGLALYTKSVLMAGMSSVCGFSWASMDADSRLHKSLISRPLNADSTLQRSIHTKNVRILFHRLFEAHFLPIHLALILTTATAYDKFWGSLVPRELQWALDFSAYCRFIGWSLMCVYFYRYAKYHHLCVTIRKEEMRKAGLLEEVTEHNGFSPKVFMVFGILEAGMFPIGGFIFGAIPACQAVLSHVFTERLVYHVSLKPQFDMQRWRRVAPSSTPQKSATQQTKAPHTRCPSDSWKKQAFSKFDHVTTAMRYRPVKRED